MYTITLANGKKLTGLDMNGTNYVSKEKVDETIFKDNLSTMKVSDGETETTYTDMVFIQQMEWADGTFYLAFREKTKEEKLVAALNATSNSKRLTGGSTDTGKVDVPSDGKTLYRVQTGAFSKRSNADAWAAKLKAAGFDTYIVQMGNLYKVQVGAYSQKSNAENMMAKLKAAGYDAFITTKSGIAAGTAKKSAAEIAKEIYNGTCSDARWSSWGNGADRVNRLKQAGYDPSEVQSEVNKLF